MRSNWRGLQEPSLVERLHPKRVEVGYRLACRKARLAP